MAEIPQIRSSRLPPRGPGQVRRPLTSATGAGLTQAGQSISRIERARDTAWALQQTVELRGRMANRATELQQAAPEDGAGVFDALSQEFDAEVRRIGEAARGQRAARMFGERADLLGADVRANARAFEQRRRVDKTVGDLGSAIDLGANQVRSDSTLYSDIRDDVMTLLEGAEADLPADAVRGLRDQAEQSLAIGAMRGGIDRDPASALEALNSGAFDKRLTPDQKDTLIGQAEREIERRQNEAEAAVRAEQSDYAAGFADYTAFLRSGNAATAAYNDAEIKAIMPADVAQEMIDARNRAEQLGADVAAIELATPEDIAAMVERRTAGLETPEDFRENASDLDSLMTALGQRQRALEVDPAGYVQRVPEMQQRWAAMTGAAELAGQATDPETRQRLEAGAQLATQAYARASLAEQERLGVPIAERRVLPTAAAGAMVARFDLSRGEEAAALIASEAERWGAAWPRVNGELVEAGLPSAGWVIGTMTTREQAWAAGRLAEIADTDTADLRKVYSTEDADSLASDVFDELEEFRASLAHVPGGQTIYSKIEEQVYRLALDLGRSDFGEAHKRSADAVINGQYEFGNVNSQTLRIPVQRDTGAALDGARTLLAFPEQLGALAPPPAATEGLVPEDAEAIYRDILSSDGYWVANSDETGALLFDPTGAMVLDRDGQPIERSWEDLERAGRAMRAAGPPMLGVFLP